MKKFFALIPLVLWHCAGTDLVRISNVRVAGPMQGSYAPVEFDVRWSNSFRDSVNWDAAWIFVKYRIEKGPWQHATVSKLSQDSTVGDDGGIPATMQLSQDGLGAFVYRATTGNGQVDWRNVRLRWNYGEDGVPDGSEVDVRVFGIEMVYIPGGPFAVGDGERSEVYGHLHGLMPGLPYMVTSEDPLTLGGQVVGRVSSNNSYGMDASFADDFDENSTVTLPSRYPKGSAPFFVMKYELTQGSYAAFLNTLSDQQVLARNPASEVAMARPGVQRYTVTTIAPFSAAIEDRPMLHLAWMDAAAFADWAALRPMTELEFEKAARGPIPPQSGEYAWGTDNIYGERYALSNADTPGERVANPGAQTGNASYANTTGGPAWCWSCLRGPMAAGAFRSDGATREESGASYYGVLHLSGNLDERTVTIGNASGRRFDGQHGDGRLNAAGRAAGPEVSRWPGSSNTGAASQIIGAVGSGFRGGNWASPAHNLRISDREFAATPDNSRQPTFGYRFVRTAPQRR